MLNPPKLRAAGRLTAVEAHFAGAIADEPCAGAIRADGAVVKSFAVFARIERILVDELVHADLRRLYMFFAGKEFVAFRFYLDARIISSLNVEHFADQI